MFGGVRTAALQPCLPVAERAIIRPCNPGGPLSRSRKPSTPALAPSRLSMRQQLPIRPTAHACDASRPSGTGSETPSRTAAGGKRRSMPHRLLALPGGEGHFSSIQQEKHKIPRGVTRSHHATHPSPFYPAPTATDTNPVFVVYHPFSDDIQVCIIPCSAEE
jgi:hypothetical protein